MTASLDARVASLEAGRQDLGAWATLLIGVVTLLLAANVGLSIWQVGGMARREAATIVQEYDRQFNGFLTKGEEIIRAAISANELRVRQLSEQLHDIAARFEKHSEIARGALAEFKEQSAQVLQRALEEAEATRARYEAELSKYCADQIALLESKARQGVST